MLQLIAAFRMPCSFDTLREVLLQPSAPPPPFFADLAESPDPGLLQFYSMTDFVVGDENQVARDAALLAATRPPKPPRPLFIVGGEGVGKTHLVQGVLNASITTRSALTVAYATATDLLPPADPATRLELLGAVDTLVVDDIHLCRDPAEREALLEILLDVTHFGAQVIATGRPEETTDELAQSVHAEFVDATVVRMAPPSLATRRRIIVEECVRRERGLSEELVELLAQAERDDVRQLLDNLDWALQLPKASLEDHSALRWSLSTRRGLKLTLRQSAPPARPGPKPPLVVRARTPSTPSANEHLEERLLSSLGDLDRVLTALEDRGLVGWERVSNRYDQHPIVRGVVWSIMGKDRRHEVCGIVEGHFTAVPVPTHPERLEDLSPSIETYHAVLEQGRVMEALHIFQRIEEPLFLLGASTPTIEMLERISMEALDTRLDDSGNAPAKSGLEAFDQAFQSWIIGPPKSASAYVLNQLALAYDLSGRPGLAAETYAKAVTYEAVPARRALVRTNEANALLLAGRMRGAAAAASEAASSLISTITDSVHRRCVADAVYAWGRTLAVRGELEVTQKAFETLLDGTALHDRLRGFIATSLADLQRRLSNVEGASVLLRGAREVAKRTRFERLEIAVLRNEALVAHDSERGDAEDILTEALSRARSLGLVEEVLPAVIALAQMVADAGHHEQALDLLGEVTAPAERGPYPLFEADALVVMARVHRALGDPHRSIEAASRALRLARGEGEPCPYRSATNEAQEILQAYGEPVEVTRGSLRASEEVRSFTRAVRCLGA